MITGRHIKLHSQVYLYKFREQQILFESEWKVTYTHIRTIARDDRMEKITIEPASGIRMRVSPTQPTLVRDAKAPIPFLTDVLSSPVPSSDDENDNREINCELASSPETCRDPSSPEKQDPSGDKLPTSSGWLCAGIFFPIAESNSCLDNRYDWCTNHGNEVATAVEMDEHQSLGGIEDGESISSLTTLGHRAFGDLASLPSVNTTTIPLSNMLTVQDIDDGSTIASLDNLSALEIKGENESMTSEKLFDDNESVYSGVSIDSDKVEAAVEKKLKQISSSDDLLVSPSLISQSSKVNDRRNKSGRERQHGIPFKSAQSMESMSYSDLKAGSTKSRRQALVKELRLSIKNYGRYDIRCANVTAALGEIFDEMQEFSQALKLQREVVSIYSTKLGDHHVTTISSKVRLGKLLEKTGDIDTAIETYYHVLNMRRSLAGDKDSSVPDALTYISRALKNKGRAEQAIKELKRALKMYRESLGDCHPRVTATVDEISALYIIVGDFAKAAAILEEVVKLKAATMGVNNTHVAQTLLQLATAYECKGDYLQGLKSLKKAYAVFASVKGDTSEETTNALKRIAINFKISGDTERSVAAYIGVLKGRKHSLGDNNPLVAKTYLDLGMALRDHSQPEKAMKCLRQALAIYVGEGKEVHDVGMIAEVMHEMAVTQKSKGELTEASRIFKQELAIRKKMGEREKPKIAKTLHHIGNTELERRNHTQALNFFMEALSIYENVDEDLSINFAETLSSTGLVFEATRHFDRATEAFKEARSIFQSHGIDTTNATAILINKKLGQNLDNGNDSSCSKDFTAH